MAALSLPVKDVADAMGDFEPKKSERRANKSTISVSESSVEDRGGLRLPNTNLNQAKLKLILKQLKKMDESKVVNSSRYN